MVEILRSAAPVVGSRVLPEAYKTAKEGGAHAGTYRNYINRASSEIQKAMRGHEAQVREHIDKLQNPEKYVKDWASKSPEYQQGLLNKWLRDLRRNQALADIMKGILMDRGELP